MEIDTTQIYFPSEDTYLLIKAALAEVKPNDRVLEIGTGSGAVAKSVTEDNTAYPRRRNKSPRCKICTRSKRYRSHQRGSLQTSLR